jgi:hypothetical protein
MFGDPARLNALADQLDSVGRGFTAAAGDVASGLISLVFVGDAATRAQAVVIRSTRLLATCGEEMHQLSQFVRTAALQADGEIRAYRAEQAREEQLRQQQLRQQQAR